MSTIEIHEEAACQCVLLNFALATWLWAGVLLSAYRALEQRLCVRACLPLPHLNDIKVLCKLSPWHRFGFPSPSSTV
uniref:Secreted protein n=1 Tax=Knipowitschia caucasica TaxID=637954 RepID=A0AAV2LSQ7_KNICA